MIQLMPLENCNPTIMCAAPREPNEKLIAGNFKGEWWNPLPNQISEKIRGRSWKENCPVPLCDLAYVKVSHWNLKNEISSGELIYHKNLAPEIIEIFKELFDAQFPIEKLVLIDTYDANDDLSMADNNSSAFCSREKTGKPGTFSNHSYGGTIDLNPLFNPYVTEDTILPKGAEKFCNREQDIPGLIKEGDCCFQAFIKRGYTWGGNWKSLKDYQHFEKSPDTFIK